MSNNQTPIRFRSADARRRMELLSVFMKKHHAFTLKALPDDKQRDDARWMWRAGILECTATPTGLKFKVTREGRAVRARADEIYAEDAAEEEGEAA